MGCACACCEGCERWGKGEVERGAEVRGEGGGEQEVDGFGMGLRERVRGCGNDKGWNGGWRILLGEAGGVAEFRKRWRNLRCERWGY